jgi:hypothetical protein
LSAYAVVAVPASIDIATAAANRVFIAISS